MPIFGFGASNDQYDLLLKSPNVIASTALASIVSSSESSKVSCPLIWDQEKDTYYEPVADNYFGFVGSSSQITDTNGYKSEPDLTVHSYIKVCTLLEDRTINYYVTINASSFEGSPGVQSDGTGNSTVGKIAGRWERVIANYITSDTNGTLTIANPGNGYQYAVSSTRLQTLANGQLRDNSPNYSYEFSTFQQTNHNFITGSKIRCTNTGNNSTLVLNRVYYAIKVSSTTFRVANTYQDALDGVFINITSGTNITFTRQSGWIVVEEGGIGYGNGGSPLNGGKGNKYIRNPYSSNLKTKSSLPSYNSSKSYFTGDRVLHSVVVNQLNTVLVWECLDNQDVDNAVQPELGVVDADLTGVHGDVMLEIPEFYIRKDHFDGVTWSNIKGQDVSKDYTMTVSNGSALGLVVSPFTTGEKVDFHFTWLLHKRQYDSLSQSEQSKYLLHPAFMKETDSLGVRTYRLTGKEAGLEMPSGNTFANGQTNAIVSRHPHYFVVGKAVQYYDPIDKSITIGTTTTVNLALGVYYVSSIVNTTTYHIAQTKGGNTLTGYHTISNIYSYGLKGYWFPVVTKEAQQITGVAGSGGATFTTQQDHQFLVGQKVQLSYSGTINNFTTGSTYYIANPNYTNFTFQLSTSLSNATASTPIVVQFSAVSNLSNALAIPEVLPNNNNNNPELIVNSLTGNDSLNLDWLPGYSTHFLSTGQSIVYKGSLNGLISGAVYYVIVVNSSFTIKLASTYENAMLNVPITNLSGGVVGSSIKRAEYMDVQIAGTPRDILTVNTNNSNSYRTLYKGLFAGNTNVTDIVISGISTVDGAALTFTANGHGLTNDNTVYLSYSERCNLGYFGRYHHQNDYYWVKVVDVNQFQLATTQNGTSLKYKASGTSSWANFANSGGMKVSIYRANSVKIGGGNDGFSLGILGVGSNNNLMLSAPSDELIHYPNVFSSRPRTGQQITYGIIRAIQAVGRSFSSKVGGSGSLLIRNGMRFRFRAVGNLSNVNTDNVYEVRNKNDVTGEFDIVLEGTSTVLSITPAGGLSYNGLAIIKPVIFDDIPPGNYFINTNADNTITLHKTYNESLSKSNPITIKPQPNYRNSNSSFDNTNTVNAYDYDFYGQLHRVDDCLCFDSEGVIKNNNRSVTEATNKNLNYYKGNGLIINALQLLAVQEFRKMNINTTLVTPFTSSNRIGLFYLFNNVYFPYTTVQENAVVFNEFAVPIGGVDIIKPMLLQGARYNSLVGCLTTKNVTTSVTTNSLAVRSSMWFVLGFPSKQTVGLGSSYTDLGVHHDGNRVFNSSNAVYDTRAASFAEGSLIPKGWQYFLTT